MKNSRENEFYSPTPFEKPIRPIIIAKEDINERLEFLARPKKIFK